MKKWLIKRARKFLEKHDEPATVKRLQVVATQMPTVKLTVTTRYDAWINEEQIDNILAEELNKMVLQYAEIIDETAAFTGDRRRTAIVEIVDRRGNNGKD